MSDYLDPNNEELLKDFFMEAGLQVDSLEQNILVLENDPSNHDAIDEIFRAAHTLKGAAATVQMTELAKFTHLFEDVLDSIRSDEITTDESVVDSLLASIDIIKAMLESRGHGDVYGEDISEICGRLSAFMGKSSEHVPDDPVPVGLEENIDTGDQENIPFQDLDDGWQLTEYDVLELREAAEPDEVVFEIRVEFNEDHPMNTIGGVQIFAKLKDLGTILKTLPDFEELYEDVFHPVVKYYLAGITTGDAVRAKLDIPDVVVSVNVSLLNETGFSDKAGGDEKPSRAASQAPATAKKDAPVHSSTPVPAGKAGHPDSAPAVNRVQTASLPQDEGKKLPDGKKEPLETDEYVRKEPELKKSGTSGSVLRVDSRRIDNLLNLVSEAVITKATFNQISVQFNDIQAELANTDKTFRDTLRELFESLPDFLERIQRGGSIKAVKQEILERYEGLYTILDPFEGKLKSEVAKLRTTSQNLARTTSDLQEGVMQIRMVPISQIFSRFPRLVRDVSKSLGKKVNLVIEGEDTELDKSVIEDLLDPLIHCVRNSVDHGIEQPEEREKNGKPAEGKILLKASNEGNLIIIEIKDDGKGIDVESVHRKAIERGLIHPNKKLSDLEAFNMIFEPGFSTAKQVTNISGRGVGLDVVRKQIEKVNGSVSVWSEKNNGTKLVIKIPLTLAIIQGLLIRVGNEIYAIPITSIIDSHRIKPSEIKMIDNYEVFNVRDDVVSLIRLNRLFKIPSKEEREHYFVVIIGSEDKRMGLVVDSLIGEEDVVIKPLKDKYTNSPGIAGATILGDGTVSLIIDVSQLLELGLKQERENRKRRSMNIN